MQEVSFHAMVWRCGESPDAANLNAWGAWEGERKLVGNTKVASFLIGPRVDRQGKAGIIQTVA
jgi:hypothetical protein